MAFSLSSSIFRHTPSLTGPDGLQYLQIYIKVITNSFTVPKSSRKIPWAWAHWIWGGLLIGCAGTQTCPGAPDLKVKVSCGAQRLKWKSYLLKGNQGVQRVPDMENPTEGKAEPQSLRW